MIGPYTKVRLLGDEGREDTWLVEDRTNVKQYAAKFIRVNSTDEIELKKNLEILKRIKHPHLVEIIDFFKNEIDNTFAIIMEYCAGNII